MTQHGCADDCQMCAGNACSACQALDLALPIAANCPHDPVERHHGMGALALAQSRVPTKPMPPIELEFSIVIEVADDMIEGLARYHEAVARALRAKGKVTLSVR